MSDREQGCGLPGWKRTTLGKALPIHYGKARNEKYGTVREDTPVYGSSGRIDTFKRALTGRPSLIIGRKGTVGATYYCPEPCWPIDTVYFVEASAGEDLRFFKYLLDHLQLARMDRSTAVPGLSRDDYNATEVFIPELDQQRLIVAEIEKQFSRLDEAVANLKRVKANLKRYKAAVLKAAVEGKLTEDWRKQHPNVQPASKLLERILAERRAKWCGRGKYKEPAKSDTSNLWFLPTGWVWTSPDQLSQVNANAICAGPFGTIFKAKDFRPAGVPIIFLRHIAPGRYLRHKPGFMHETKWKELFKPYSVFGGELLVTKLGEPPGVCAIYPEGIGPAMVTPDVIKMSVNSTAILPKLMMHYLNSDIARRFATGAAFGTTRLRVTLPIFREMPVPLPPLAEQEQIVAEVERRLSVIDELEATVEANLTRADRLRQSILSQAFSGKLSSQQCYNQDVTARFGRVNL